MNKVKKLSVAFLGIVMCGMVGLNALSIAYVEDMPKGYPNGDWEVYDEIDNSKSQWSEKIKKCDKLQYAYVPENSKISREEAKKQGVKCLLKYAKQVHKFCKKNELKSCTLEALLLAGASNEEEALKILKQTCESGYGIACSFAAQSFEDRGDRTNALEWLEKGCSFGSATSCFGVSMIHFRWFSDLPKVKQYADKTIAYAQKGCDDGFERACRVLDSIKEFIQKNNLE